MSKNRSVRSPLRYNKIANLSRRGKIAAVAVLFLSIVSLAAIGSTAGRNAVAGPIAAYFGFSQPEARPTAATVQDKERGTLIAQIDEKAEPASGQEVQLFRPFLQEEPKQNSDGLVASVKKPEAKSASQPTFDEAFRSNDPTGLVFQQGIAQAFTDGDDARTRAQKGDGDEDEPRMAEKPLRPGIATDTGKPIDRKPVESKLIKTGKSFDGDLRSLPYVKPRAKERPERGEPSITRGFAGNQSPAGDVGERPATPSAPSAAAPPPTLDFDGLDRESWGAGSPPDTNGDVGPNHYIQTVNTSVGIYNKSTGAPIARFTFNTLMSQGNFGNLCDTDNFGDPVVLYDTFEDRWILTDFAFQLDGGGAVINPPGSFQCFAVSKTSDPVAGGWNFYSVNTVGGLGDYPKFGVWTDGLYMTTSIFDYAAGGAFQNPRAYAFNKAQMYAGAPTVQIVSFNLPAGDFTVLPSNARLQTGTPPAGSPNYYVSSWMFLNALSVYKFHVDWDRTTLSTFSAAAVPIAATSWPNASVASVPQSGTAQLLDNLAIRAMMQNQYTNIGGVESLWNTHTVRRTTTGFAAPRWYQLTVAGGTISPNILQAATWDPDGSDVMHRFMPSLAVNRAGNMAIGYSTSSSTTFPSIKYAGRLSTDPANTFSQTEQTMFAGTASQTSTNRWGDYSAMTVDPDGCTFWFTSQYANPVAQTFDKRWKTRIGTFQLPACTPVGAGGTISGTVTSTVGGTPISGATVSLGSRSVATDIAGAYSFTNIPAGTYPLISASSAGFNGMSTPNVVVADGGTTTDDFALSPSATNACPVDTSKDDFQTGVWTSSLDLLSVPGDITLSNVPTIDQQNTSLINSGFGFSNTAWHAQTFTPTVTGQATKVDMNFFSLNCSAVTMPAVTVSIRNATGNLPTGADLATATIPGFCNGAGDNFTATFTTPATLTAGTQYAIVWRASAVIPAGSPAPGYFATASSANPYAGGRRATSSNSGSTWTGATGTANNDFGFKVYMQGGFATSGNLVSSAKDSNPPTGSFTAWGPLSWTAVTPAGTDVKFQIAGSNSAAGIFNFVGPDGTAATFFTNGASLSQFNGSRYLKYKALFTGTSAATPTLNDVTICFAAIKVTTLTVAPAAGSFGGTANVSATLTDSNGPVSGQSIAFTLNGVGAGSAVTNASGVASIPTASLVGINAGTYPTGVGASFVSDGVYGASAGTASLTVDPAGQTITFAALSDKVFGDAPFTASAGGGASGNPVTFGATGNCSASGVNGSTITMTGAGSCTVTASQLGNSNFAAAADVARTFNIAKATPTITWSNPAGIVYGTALTATQLNATSGTPGSFVYTPAAGVVLGAGNGQALHVDFTPTDTANYNGASANASIDVAKANASCSVTGYNVTYNGAAHTATGSCTGIGGAGDVLAGLNLAGTTHTAIGDYPNDPWVFTGGANYNDQNGTVADTIVQAECNSLAIATGIQTLRNQEVTVPVTVDNLTGRNVLSYTYTLTYDPSSVSYSGFDKIGTVSTNMIFTINSNTPGTLVVVAFGSAPLVGSGVLVNLKFNAYGAIGSTSPMNLSGFTFNEGVPCVETSNGSVTIASSTIDGVVTYALAPVKPVPHTVLNAAGSSNVSANSALVTGAYTLSGMGTGAYTVTPSKTGDVNGITGFDSAMIAQHVAGLITLTSTQMAAADVSGNGNVTAFDAALISQWIASIPNSGITGTWKFTPVSRSYPNAETAQVNQDYSAILMGEVSGSWTVPTTIAPPDEQGAVISQEKIVNGSKKGIGVTAPTTSAAPGTEVTIPVAIKDLTGKGVVAYQFDLEYDPAVLEPAEVAAELSRTISDGMSVTSNAPTPGLLKVVVYGATPVQGAGALVNLKFNAIGGVGAKSPLTIKQFMLNEGGLKVNTTDGEVTVEASRDAALQGRLISADGRFIAKTRVTITSSAGERRVAVSNSFGVFEFDGLTVGETYTITADSASHQFTPQTVSAMNGVVTLDLVTVR